MIQDIKQHYKLQAGVRMTLFDFWQLLTKHKLMSMP